MAENTRSYVSADQKVLSVKRHLLDRVPVSQLCDELKISVNTFYNWQRELFENGHLAFAKNGRGAGKVEEVQRQDRTISQDAEVGVHPPDAAVVLGRREMERGRVCETLQ